MTTAQLTVLNEVTEKMREHFSAAILVVELEGDEEAPPPLLNQQ